MYRCRHHKYGKTYSVENNVLILNSTKFDDIEFHKGCHDNYRNNVHKLIKGIIVNTKAIQQEIATCNCSWQQCQS